MNSKEVLQAFAESTDGLLQAFDSFNASQVNIIPFEGSWTAGQVAEHLYKSMVGLPEMLRGATKETERPVDAMTPAITSIFLDFSTKLQSPDFIIPSNGPHSKDEMLHSLATATESIALTAAEIDLTKTVTSFPFPQLGEFTVLEWVYFVSCHCKRHTRQLKNIYSKLPALQNV